MNNRILIIDDEKYVRDFVCESLELYDYQVDQAENGRIALDMMKGNEYSCVISDIKMPVITGLEFLRECRKTDKDTPIIMLTGVKELQTVITVMKLGAQDYLTKPFDVDELVFIVEKSIEYKRLREQNKKLIRENEKYQKHLEEMVVKRTAQLEEAVFGSLVILASTIEAKDPYTKGHSNRVRLISIEIARKMGLSEKEIDILEYGAMLHDVGKIGVRDDILQKKGKLTDEEFDHIKSHPTVGAKIVEDISYYKPMIACIKHHHEKYDGTGYPDSLKGREIPLLARIIATADTYDAMTSTRPYREGLSKEKSISILKEIRGIQLDPNIVDVFINHRIYEIDFDEVKSDVSNEKLGRLSSFFEDEELMEKPTQSSVDPDEI